LSPAAQCLEKGHPMSVTSHARMEDALNVLRELAKLLIEP
jgi:hypothetical protein